MNDEMNKDTAPQAAEPSTPSSTAKPAGEYKPPIFLDLVISVGAGALQVLVFEAGGGEGEEGPNLDLARYSIDMLELLKARTKGNLEKDEEKFLDETIHQLRMKYVEAARKQGEEA